MWSMGCMVFELLTGDLLFEPKNGKQFDKNDGKRKISKPETKKKNLLFKLFFLKNRSFGPND